VTLAVERGGRRGRVAHRVPVILGIGVPDHRMRIVAFQHIVDPALGSEAGDRIEPPVQEDAELSVPEPVGERVSVERLPRRLIAGGGWVGTGGASETDGDRGRQEGSPREIAHDPPPPPPNDSTQRTGPPSRRFMIAEAAAVGGGPNRLAAGLVVDVCVSKVY